MKVKTSEQYKARFNERGQQRAKFTRPSDFNGMFTIDLTRFSKPQHEKRFHNIADCFPKLTKKPVDVI